MEKLKFIVPLLLFTHWGLAQTYPDKNSNHTTGKPPIDHSVYDKWPVVGNAKISNNGTYAMYTIYNMPSKGNHTLVIHSVHKPWKKEFAGGSSADFTQDSKRAVLQIPGDSLCLLELGTAHTSYIPYVIHYKLAGQGKDEYLLYRLNKPSNQLVVRNLYTGKEQRFSNVTNYSASGNGKVLLLETEIKTDSAVSYALQWVPLQKGEATTIWQGKNAGNYVFDDAATQLVFTVEDTKNGEPGCALWLYQQETKQAKELVNDQTKGIEARQLAYNFPRPRFSKDGTKIFFRLKEAANAPVIDPSIAKVDIWHYKDDHLQTEQWSKQQLQRYEAVINIDSKKVIPLNGQNEQIVVQDHACSDYVLGRRQMGHHFEAYWRTTAQPMLYLISTKNGERKLITKHAFAYESISPGGKYVIYFDCEERHWFSYNIEKGVATNISKEIPVPLYNEEGYEQKIKLPDLPVSGWLPDEQALVYDRFDIWQLDLSGRKPPVNVTSGYGRKHNIIFRLGNKDNEIIKEEDELLLTAFNLVNKYNGFYKLQLKNNRLQLLTMGPYIYSVMAPGIHRTFSPVKAGNTAAYIVRRESEKDAPNYYYTNDFQKFLPLSSICPQKEYNWMIAELVHWKTFDGRMSEGILYKPENFDSTKKHPVIFHFYEKLSNRLHQYLPPEPIHGALRIPWFVSNGYLVFTPDIQYTVGEPGESAYNSVVSAARYLSKFPWVDSTKMGIQGHSFGGYEVNYLVTRTNMFAAAAEAAGASDLVSQYGGGNTVFSQWVSEEGIFRFGGSLWQKKEQYIRNSPVLKADSVQTPLLIMHNRQDKTVLFTQAVEWFTALRRLGKKGWLLQYDGHGHQLSGKAADDYTARLSQFFDHYLKGAAPPIWLTKGIPARLEGVDSDMELDISGKQP